MMMSMPFSKLYIAWLCVAGILFIPGVLANGMIIYALIKIEKLRVPTNYLLASLAVADLMMMAVMAGFVFSDVFQVDIPHRVATYLWPSFDIFIGSASIMNLAAVSCDRALAAVRPLQYHDSLNVKQTFRAIRCIWGYSLVMFILSMLRCDIKTAGYRDGVLYTAYVGSFCLPCLVILVSYILILMSTIKNVKISRAIEKALYSAKWLTQGNQRGNAAEKSVENKRTRRLRLQEIRITTNLMIILLPFTAGWGFYFGTHFYEGIVGQYQRNDLYEWFLTIIPWFNSSVNPLVYILFTTALRKGCMKLLCRKRYLSQARETLLTNLVSKRNSSVDRPANHPSGERSSVWDRIFLFGRQSGTTSVESDFGGNGKVTGNVVEMRQLQETC